MDDLTDCQICFESYNLSDRTPRLLPCSHTVCEPCLKALIKDTFGQKKAVCPECRHQHPITNDGVRTFPQNRYIIRFLEKENEKRNPKVNIRKESTDQTHKASFVIPDGSTCRIHQQPYLFFCNEEQCRLFLCNTCQTEQHKSHTVTDLIEEAERCKKNLLDMASQAERLARILDNEKQKVFVTEEELKSHAKEALFQLDQRKDRLVELIKSVIDNMKHEIIQQRSTELLKMHDVVKTLEGGASKFRDVANETMVSSENSSFMDLIKEHNTTQMQLKDLMQVVSTVLSEQIRFNHFEFKPVDAHLEERYSRRLVGQLEPRDIYVDFLKSNFVVLRLLEANDSNTDLSSISGLDDTSTVIPTSSLMRSDSVIGAGYDMPTEDETPSSPARRPESHDQHQSRDECLKTFSTYLEPLQAYQCLVEDGSIIVSGCSAGIWWLKQFKDDGGFLWQKQVATQPTGLASFKIPQESLDGSLKPYLVVSYKQENKIDFHSMEMKDEVAFTYDIPGQDPGCLVYNDQPKKLIYVDEATYPSALREVELPEAGLFRRSMHLIITKSRNISGLCLLKKTHGSSDNSDILVIVTDGEKLCAYSYLDASPAWQLAGDVSSSSGAGVMYNINPLGICVVKHSTKSLIYIADCNNKSILKVDKKGKVVKIWPTRGTSLGGPRQLTYDITRSQLFVLHVKADGRLHVNVY